MVSVTETSVDKSTSISTLHNITVNSPVSTMSTFQCYCTYVSFWLVNWSCFNIRVLDNMATLLRTTPANTLRCRHQGIGTHRHYHHKDHPYTSHSWWTSPKQHPRVCLISHVLGRSLAGDPHSSGSLSLGGLCYTRAPGWPLILKSLGGLCNTREPVWLPPNKRAGWSLLHKRAGVASATQESRGGHCYTRAGVATATQEPG